MLEGRHNPCLNDLILFIIINDCRHLQERKIINTKYLDKKFMSEPLFETQQKIEIFAMWIAVFLTVILRLIFLHLKQ